MRVLLAMDRLFPPQRSGGIESSVHDMANALLRYDVEVAVLCRLYPYDAFGLGLLMKRAVLGGRVRPYMFGNGYPLYRALVMRHDLLRVLGDFVPDVAVFQGSGRYDLGALLQNHGVPTVLHVRDVEFKHPRLDFTPRKVIANSSFTANCFEKRYGIQPTVIHNIFDETAYRVDALGDRVVFINPVKKKGLEIALALARDNPMIPFLFVEGWPQGKKAFARLKDLVSEFPNIELWRRQNDMRCVYAKARVVLVPSQCDEAWGRVVSEAHVSGIPVLASDRGGIPEALGNGGLLLPPDDVACWNSALRKVWDTPEYWAALSRAALAHADRSALKVETIMDQLMQTLVSASHG